MLLIIEAGLIQPLNLGYLSGSCHGLPCSHMHSNPASSIHTLNPITKECRIIPEPETNGDYAVGATGFGFISLLG